VGMKSENEGVELKNEGVEIENVGIKSENEGVELKNEGVEIENVGMKSENEGVEMKNDGVQIKIKLNKTQSNLLEILSRNGVFSAKDLTEMLSVSLSTVERNLSFLQKNGFIKREGSDRYGKWIVLKKK
ncbi:MAG: winged helix-turn-helix transcriptional regulator, partial [Bacteroidales bacterium]|nr:winged helix-turn-helix transcriptional regulator [Bacteroidales bacterium]